MNQPSNVAEYLTQSKEKWLSQDLLNNVTILIFYKLKFIIRYNPMKNYRNYLVILNICKPYK